MVETTALPISAAANVVKSPLLIAAVICVVAVRDRRAVKTVTAAAEPIACAARVRAKTLNLLWAAASIIWAARVWLKVCGPAGAAAL